MRFPLPLFLAPPILRSPPPSLPAATPSPGAFARVHVARLAATVAPLGESVLKRPEGAGVCGLSPSRGEATVLVAQFPGSGLTLAA